MIARKPVQILSPLRAANGRSEQDHVLFADKLCHLAATLGGVAPFAPHTFYTRFLDDRRPEERTIGLDCGSVWLGRADEVWVWDLWGISEGMAREIAFIEDLNAATGNVRLGPPLFIEVRGATVPSFIAIRYASLGGVPAWEELIHAHAP